jgi:hypothetical protein
MCAGEGRGEQAALASVVGPEVGRLAQLGALSFLFLNLFSKSVSKAFLIILKAFSEVSLKTKVIQNKILYNFSLRCNPRI